MAQRGVRFIKGREYLLAGRYSDSEQAHKAAKDSRERWYQVRVIKRHNWDFLIYVHGAKP